MDNRGKIIPYLTKDIKSKPISGLWIYNDSFEYGGKGKLTTNQVVQSSCLNYLVWTHLLRFVMSIKKLSNEVETASKSSSSLLLSVFFKHKTIKPVLCEFKINEVMNSLKKRRNSTKVENQLRNLKNRWIVYSSDQATKLNSDTQLAAFIIYLSKSFTTYSKQVLKHNNRKRSVSTIKRSISTSYIHDNSENIHPNRLSSGSYINQSYDVGRNCTLRASNSYCKTNNNTIQDNETSWYSGQRPLSAISINNGHAPQVNLKRKQGETGSTIGSSNPMHLHTTINSISEEDNKNFFYRPLNNVPVSLSNYKP